MTTHSDQTEWTVAGLLDLLDVTPDGQDHFTGLTGLATGGDRRQVVEGTQLLAQAIVAAAKRFPQKSVRSAHAVFARAALADPPIGFAVDVVHEGRSMATAVISVQQGGKTCATVTVLADSPSTDVIRHHFARPDVAGPGDAHVSPMPMTGRELRVVDVVDVNSPDEVGPPELYAWLHYEPIPTRDDLAKALVAHFTGHLGISTTMRAHKGIGTSQSHYTVSTAPMSVTVSFHEPVRWDGWLLYSHESTQAGAGMSYVRGHVHTEEGDLLASFTQEAMIRPLRNTDTSITVEARL